MSDETMNVSLGARIDDLLSKLTEATAGVKEAAEGMQAPFERLNGVVGNLKTAFLGVGAAIAGGEMFEHLIEGTEKLGIEMEKASAKTGMTVEQLSQLKYASEASDVPFEQVVDATTRLARAMETATSGTGQQADAFRALGIQFQDTHGKLRPMNDVLGEIADKFKNMPDGTTKTALAVALFGRAGAEMIPVLNQGRDGLKALGQEADLLGATMGEKDVEAAKDYHLATFQLHQSLSALGRVLAETLMPALSATAQAFTAAVVILEKVWEYVKMVARAFGDDLGDSIRSVGKAFSLIVHGQFSEAMQVMSDHAHRIDQEYSDTFQHIREDAAKTGEALNNAFNREPPPDVEGGGDDDTPTFVYGRRTRKGKKKSDRVQAAIVENLDAELGLRKKRPGIKDLSTIDTGARPLTKEQLKQQKKDLADLQKAWTGTFATIDQSVRQSFDSMVRGTMTLGEAFQKLGRDLVLHFGSASLKTLQIHASTELAKSHLTAQGVTERVALETWAAVKMVAVNAWAALTAIANYAATAIAAAWASVSAIPIVGPFLAPATAALVGASVLALAGNIRSAAGGFDIPSGLNPVTQLHANEMVLPAELANKVRGMTEGGSGETHVHIHAWDSRDIRRFVMDNRDHFTDAVRQAMKDGKRV